MTMDRSRITVELPAELVEECRDAVVFLSGPPDRLTMAGLVREALRALTPPAGCDERTPAQRRADALVDMARIALANLEPEPGRKRRRPKVVATSSITDLENRSRGGSPPNP